MENFWGQFAIWLNDNGGVLTALLALVSGTTYSVRWVISRSRNPNAPSYGAPRPVSDFMTKIRTEFARVLSKLRGPRAGAITIGYFGFAFDYLPLFVARRKKFFSSLGKQTPLRFISFDNYSDLQDAMTNGSVDFVAMSSVPATRARCEGAELYAIELLAAHAQCIVTPWVNVSVIRDLKGASIATAEYSSSHFGVLYAFENAGIPIDTNALEFVNEDLGRRKLRNGEVSAWAVWPLHSDYEVVLSSARELIGSDVPVFSVMTQVGEPSDKALFIARSIRDGLWKAKNWIAENEAEAIRFAAREFGVPRKVVKSAWRRISFCAKINYETELDFKRDSELMARHAWIDADKTGRMEGFVRIV